MDWSAESRAEGDECADDGDYPGSLNPQGAVEIGLEPANEGFDTRIG